MLGMTTIGQTALADYPVQRLSPGGGGGGGGNTGGGGSGGTPPPAHAHHPGRHHNKFRYQVAAEALARIEAEEVAAIQKREAKAAARAERKRARLLKKQGILAEPTQEALPIPQAAELPQSAPIVLPALPAPETPAQAEARQRLFAEADDQAAMAAIGHAMQQMDAEHARVLEMIVQYLTAYPDLLDDVLGTINEILMELKIGRPPS